MRQLSRRERAALGAAENSVERHPELHHAVLEEYAQQRAHVHDLREMMEKHRAAAGRHPDEPGSKSEVRHRRGPWGVGSRSAVKDGDGPGYYGEGDHTGFAPGAVYQVRGTLAISWGPWGGFYILTGRRVCLGFVALTYCPIELDDLMEAYADPHDGGRLRG